MKFLLNPWLLSPKLLGEEASIDTDRDGCSYDHFGVVAIHDGSIGRGMRKS